MLTLSLIERALLLMIMGTLASSGWLPIGPLVLAAARLGRMLFQTVPLMAACSCTLMGVVLVATSEVPPLPKVDPAGALAGICPVLPLSLVTTCSVSLP